MRLRNSGARLCDGLNRREFRRVGGIGLAGLTWPLCTGKPVLGLF
jgi:hypothetical protein